MKKKIVIATDGLLLQDYAKTAHGLIRDSKRFEVLAVIDKKFNGLNIGQALKGASKNISVIASVDEAIKKFKKIDYLVIGVATVGGVLSNSLLVIIRNAISNGIGIINGLHDQLGEREDIKQLAKKNQVELIDIRKPKPFKDLHFWTGSIFKVNTPIVAFLAMDCALGKRTTARLVMDKCLKTGIHAEMIYTGQTGWMQGGKYGFIFDSTINDFVSGELENAIVTCWEEEKPDLILLEGQSSLRSPSGPCGLEFLISGNAKQVVLIHAPNKKYFDNKYEWGQIPTIKSEIEIIEKFGSKVIALALNTNGLTKEQALSYQTKYQDLLGIPIVMPLEEGVTNIISAIKGL